MANEKVRKGYHCAWQIHYHIVFPVKYRKTLLDSEVTNIIQETAEGIAGRYPVEMEAIGCDKDHIHLLCGAHPKVAPGRIVQIFKSITAREIFRRKPSVKKSFGVVSFGPMAITSQQSVKEPTGIRWKNMTENKVNPVSSLDSSDSSIRF